jgi:site-specific DNA-methyltransferase (adenine-specific)
VEAYLDWTGRVLDLLEPLLVDTGSLYWFCSPYYSHLVRLEVEKYFNVLNEIIWLKPSGPHKGAHKEGLRRYFPQTEHIIFAEHKNADSAEYVGYEAIANEVYQPLKDHLDGARKRAGVTKAATNKICGVKNVASRHYYGTQWKPPTMYHYQLLDAAFRERSPDAGLMRFERFIAEYERLKREVAARLEEAQAHRRVFNMSPDWNFTNVWQYATVDPRKGKHPTEKPLDLMEHIIRVSSRPGGVVLDPFMGSGSTGLAAFRLGRSFIGIEQKPEFFEISKFRLGAGAPGDGQQFFGFR